VRRLLRFDHHAPDIRTGGLIHQIVFILLIAA
jgi:hypothetical protein